MPTNDDELRNYLGAIAGRLEPPKGDCPEKALLFEHIQGVLPGDVREQVESHLVQCSECRHRLLDIHEFIDVSPEEQAPVSPRFVEQEWKSFRRRIGPHRTESGENWLAALFRPPVWSALAACLILGAGVYVWSVDRHSLQELASSTDHLRRENQRLLQQTASDRQLIAGLRLPRLNTPVRDAFPTGAVARSTVQQPENRIIVPETGPFTIILNAQGVRSLSDYHIDIENADGESMWQSDGLHRDNLGNFVITLQSEFLPPGDYTFIVSAKSATSKQEVARYRISLQRRP
jgi:hypothetical protein